MKLIGKGVAIIHTGYGDVLPLYVYYTVAVDIKQSRYRYRVYDFGFESGSQTEDASKGYSHYLHGEIHKQIFESKKQAIKRYISDYSFINRTALSLIENLKKNMNKLNTDTF